ncbi:MAG: DMT family transporter, partial [Sphingomonadales bacterium]
MQTELESLACANPRPRINTQKLLLPAALVSTLILWAAAFSAIPIALESFSPGQVAAGRQVLSASLTLPILVLFWRGRIWPALKRDFFNILLMGLSGITFYHLALSSGQRTIGAGAASLLVNLTPIITAIFAAWLLREKLTWRVVAGGALGFVGAAALILSGNSDFSIDWNALLIVAATISQAFYFVQQRKLTARYDVLSLAVITIWIGAITLLPFGGGFELAFTEASERSLWALVFLGAGSGLIPYIGWTYVISKLPAGRATVWLYIIPPISILIGWQLLGEQPTISLLFSGAIILTG